MNTKTRIYNVFTHYDTPATRIRAASPKEALEIGVALMATRPTPQFRSLVTEIPANGDCAGLYKSRDCRKLDKPHAARSNDQRSPSDN